ncbi:MAG: transposase [Thermodesulfovibrionales bacterium]
MKHPEWALKQKRKGTELRLIRGTYYLYEVTSRWNPEKKRAQKITGRLLGKVTPEGFIQSPKYALAQRPIQSVVVKEYGASNFLWQLISDVNSALQDAFPSCWREILIVACMRLLHQSPIKNMDFHFRHSYLSELYPDVSATDKKISSLLRTLGNWREKITQFFKTHIIGRRNDYMLIDATHLLSYSQEMDIAKGGYNNQHEFAPQVNLLFIYSATLKLPVYYRIVQGNVREVKAFKLTLQESGIKDAVVIADKGFYSEDNVSQLEEECLQFIIPLRRSSALINYTPVEKSQKQKFQGYFKFNNRYIWYYSYPVDKRMIHCYLDERLRIREEHDYLTRIETHPETHTIEDFYSRQLRFGTLAIITNIAHASPEQIYINYKSRNNIETMIDAMKNVLKADSSYMRNQTSLEGWMFITFVALQWYYRIYRLLSDKQLLSKFSPQDLLMHLTEIKKVKINDSWHTAEITSKTQKLLEKLNIHIT